MVFLLTSSVRKTQASLSHCNIRYSSIVTGAELCPWPLVVNAPIAVPARAAKNNVIAEKRNIATILSFAGLSMEAQIFSLSDPQTTS